MYPSSSDRYRRKPPTVEMSVDVEEAMVAVVDLLRAATNSIETLTNTVNERFNSTFIDASDKGYQYHHSQHCGCNQQPQPSYTNSYVFIWILHVLCGPVAHLNSILLLCSIKTRREFRKRKHPRSISTSPSATNRSASPAKKGGLRTYLPEWARKKTGSSRLRHMSASPPAVVIGRRNTETDFPAIDSHYSTSPTLPITKKPSVDTLV
uniref:Uncharacterized protein n=1 Tax=Ditylenchus dipsaci TaxID=166011 RepID=A0A915CW41_9BILA